jgi:hypothetical protein
MSNSPLEAGIPVLTEVIPASLREEEAAARDTEAEVRAAPEEVTPAPEPMPAPTPAREEGSLTPETRAAIEWNEEEWERLEREVRERILRQVLDRVDFVLEQRVRDSLADVLQVAVEGLATEIRGGLHHTIRDVVTRAVAQEITHMQTTKK